MEKLSEGNISYAEEPEPGSVFLVWEACGPHWCVSHTRGFVCLGIMILSLIKMLTPLFIVNQASRVYI